MVQLCGYVDPLILVIKCLGEGWNEPKGRRPHLPRDQVNTHTHNIAHYIGVRWDTILAYVVNRPIYQKCREGVREQGSAPRQWWWEQPMQFDENEAAEQ